MMMFAATTQEIKYGRYEVVCTTRLNHFSRASLIATGDQDRHHKADR